MVIQIELTQGKTALIDDEFALLGTVKWCADKFGKGINARYYAQRNGVRGLGKRRNFRLHRLIMECQLGRFLKRDEDIDHVNHDGLDNRLVNLRVVSRQQNLQHQRTQCIMKSSKYKGVSWEKRRGGNWLAQIKKPDGNQKFLGYFDDENLAAVAYDNAAKKYFKDYAVLNFPEET